jgi:predicted RNase H-like nuclease
MAAFVRPDSHEIRVRVFAQFAELIEAPEQPQVIAVDMPIGLPERIGPGGRGPERAVRPLLGARQSSVFAVPARRAVYASSYGEACTIAQQTSDPPRKVSKQLFMIAPKIRELDGVLRADPVLARRVFEVHPEMAFWRLNGNCSLTEPKKVKSSPYPPGLALRRRILVDSGFLPEIVMAAPPKGAQSDDLIDALACSAIARRIHTGVARSFPTPPACDDYGLPMAIWT